MSLQTVRVEQVIHASADRVWQRISTPEGLARWWRPGNIAPVKGHDFTMDMGKWGDVACRVLEVEPNRKLVYRWGEFELHWQIEDQGDRSLLILEHRGFDLNNPQHRFAYDNMGPGWAKVVLPGLAEGLAEAV